MRVAAAVLLLLATADAARPQAPLALVACAPGQPGTTGEAQPRMDTLAAALARGAGWPPGALAGVYLPGEQDGLARLDRPDAAVALVPLPFYAKHAAALGLEPRLAVVPEGAAGPTEVWTLVAGKGRVSSAAALEGYTISSSAGYAPGFVRAVLAGWGHVPASAHVAASRQVLSSLRRAASGERVAVLLDGAQATAMASLPFAAELEVVARSAPLPGALVATVRGRAAPARWTALEEAFLRLPQAEGGPAALQGLQLTRFAPLDDAAKATVRRLAAASTEAQPGRPPR